MKPIHKYFLSRKTLAQHLISKRIKEYHDDAKYITNKGGLYLYPIPTSFDSFLSEYLQAN